MLKIMIFLSVTLLYTSAHSTSKIVLPMKPVQLQHHIGYYSFPKDYHYYHNEYHFVRLHGEEIICFLQEKPSLVGLELKRIFIQEQDKTVPWYCYPLDPQYFTMDFHIIECIKGHSRFCFK